MVTLAMFGWIGQIGDCPNQCSDCERHDIIEGILVMMISSHGKIFRDTGPLGGEYTGHR